MSLEYAGTEGSSGSDASHERATREAEDGTATERQRAILDFLERQGPTGATWKELGTALGLHHGQATGSLSNLHKGQHIARLTERRDRCSVYVHPDHVGGRQTTVQGRRPAEESPVGFPYRQGTHLVLGPDVLASLDGEHIVWKGRAFHPLDVHDPTTRQEPADNGRRPLFDV